MRLVPEEGSDGPTELFPLTISGRPLRFDLQHTPFRLSSAVIS